MSRTANQGQRTRFDCLPRIEHLEYRCLMSADPVLEWNSIMLKAEAADLALTHPDQGGPTRTSRAFAIVSAAVYDTVNSIYQTNDAYKILVPGLRDANVQAAVAEAAHDTLAALFPQQKATFDAGLAADLKAIKPSFSELEGIVLGKFVAAYMLALRQNDNSDNTITYVPTGLPGNHVPDPLHPTQGFLTPGWGEVTPFVVPNITDFRSPPPPGLDTQAYTDAFNEVKALGGDGITTPTTRTADQTEIGIFWSYDGSPNVGTPPVLYDQVARTIAIQEGNTIAQNARLFTLVNLAMADAGIQAWDTKYTYDYWRPIVGIREADVDGNPNTVADPNWTPLGATCDNGCAAGSNFTPNFPSYASGHATFGGALFGILRDFYGTDNISFDLRSDEYNGVTQDQNGVVRPVVVRHYSSFTQAEEENADSRIYLGIHWRFDATAGVAAGEAIAQYVFGHALRSRTPRHHDAISVPTYVVMSEEGSQIASAPTILVTSPPENVVTWAWGRATHSQAGINEMRASSLTALGEGPADASSDLFRALLSAW